jgi:hypothetical protein
MTTLYDARNALQFGQRHEAARLLARIVQREPTNAEAWYLLAEAVDDFQQQTYCMGMATRLGYRPNTPTYAQPEPAPLLPPFATPAFTPPPAPPQIMPVMIVEPRPHPVFDLPLDHYPPPGLLQRTTTLVSSLLAFLTSVLALVIVSLLLLMLVGACVTLSQLGQVLPR